MLGIALFLCYRYCKKKRNQLPPQIKTWSDDLDGPKGLSGTLGRTYTQVPGEPIASLGGQGNQTNSLCLPSDSANVSIAKISMSILIYKKVLRI